LLFLWKHKMLLMVLVVGQVEILFFQIIMFPGLDLS